MSGLAQPSTAASAAGNSSYCRENVEEHHHGNPQQVPGLLELFLENCTEELTVSQVPLLKQRLHGLKIRSSAGD